MANNNGLAGCTGIPWSSNQVWGWGGYGGMTGSGMTGYGGMTGYTGINLCKICQSYTIYLSLSLNFSILSVFFKNPGSDPSVCLRVPEIEIDNPLNNRHPVCYVCYEKTILGIKTIDEGPVEELPLYIGDDNIFIREFAIRKLRGLE